MGLSASFCLEDGKLHFCDFTDSDVVHTFFQVREWCHLRSAQILPFDCNLNVGLAAKGLGTRLGDFANGMGRNF